MIGIIGGSGNDELPGLGRVAHRLVETPYGQVAVTEGTLGGVAVAHISRHSPGHVRLSNHVTHHANLAALRAAGVSCVVGLTVCGAVDSALPLGSVVVFDDLYFPSNRLPDGTLCTWYGEPGAAQRGHWIFDRPFSEPLRQALIAAAVSTGVRLTQHGCYGHVDGPRFNSRSEIAALRAAGVSAVSQTAGPETVLAGEAEVPYALLGFVTDYANGVTAAPEPVEALLTRMAASPGTFARIIDEAIPALVNLPPAGVVHRFTP